MWQSGLLGELRGSMSSIFPKQCSKARSHFVDGQTRPTRETDATVAGETHEMADDIRQPRVGSRLLAGVFILMMGLSSCDKDPSPAPPPAQPAVSETKQTLQEPQETPTRLATEIAEELLTQPLLMPRYFDEKKTQPAYAVSSEPRVISRTSRGDSQLLRIAVDVDRRLVPDAVATRDTLFFDLMVDATGRLVALESRGIRDADTSELEELLLRP